MTVRMLQSWNGYAAQTLVSTLSNAEETRIVGLGLASRDVDGAAENKSLVTATPDPGTGAIRLAADITLLNAVDVTAYGVNMDGLLIPGFQVSGSGNVGLCSATSDIFVASDVGKRINFHKAFVAASMANYSMYRGEITAVTDARNCTILCTSCPTLGAGAFAVFGTDNGDAINKAINVLSLSPSGGTLVFPRGICMAYKFKAARANSTPYSVGAEITQASPNGFYYKCIVDGVSDVAPPTFIDTFGSVFSDGTVKWMCMGRSTLVLPNGSVMRGSGKERGRPYGFSSSGSVLIGAGYDATYSLVELPTGTLGSQIHDAVLDACTGYKSACSVSGSSSYHSNVTYIGGTTSAFNNAIGSTETVGCHFTGRLQDNAVALDTVGDAQHLGGFASGAGNGAATVRAKNITDDMKINGMHMYKGGWCDLNTVAGPNLRIESTTSAIGGGNIVANTFDSSYGPQIELYVHGASAGGIQALTIANNQFYQPIAAFPTNTYPVIKIEATATAPAVSYAALSIMGNVAKGTPAGNQYSAFIQYALNAGTQVVADSVIGNTVNNCAALYTGTAHTQSYTAGNSWRTTAGVTTVG
jgi:hypothetical protein